MFTLPQLWPSVVPRGGVCSGRYWGLLPARPVDNMDEWSQTDNPTDIDLTHITAAHNRQGIASPADKHSPELDKGCQEAEQLNHIVTS